MLLRAVILYLFASNAWSACLDSSMPPLTNLEFNDGLFISNINEEEILNITPCGEENYQVWEQLNSDLVLLNTYNGRVNIKHLPRNQDGYPSSETTVSYVYPEHAIAVENAFSTVSGIYLIESLTGDLYFIHDTESTWQNLSLLESMPNTPIKNFFAKKGRLYFSVASGVDEGIWSVSGGSIIQLTDRPAELSPIYPTPQGLSQAKLGAEGYGIFWLESEVLSLSVGTQGEPQSYKYLNHQSGHLITVGAQLEVWLYWDDSDDANDQEIPMPDGWLRFQGCHAGRLEIMCAIQMNDGNLNLYRVISGGLELDAVLSHQELTDADSYITQINAIGGSRYIALVKDSSYFLYEVNETGIDLVADSELNSYMHMSIHSSVIYWMSNTSKRLSLSNDTDYVSLLPEPEPIEDVTETTPDNREIDSEENSADEEEDKEIPFAEMSSSLNLYLLMLSLFILFPARLRK